MRFTMQASNERIAAITYAAALAAALLFVGAAVAAPLMEAAGGDNAAAASFIYLAYSRVCHQIADRSFHVEGYPLAVCSRCFGIYAGYVSGLAVYPFVRSLARTEAPGRVWLLLALAPVAIDFAGGYVGVFDNTLLSRALTGLVAGAAGAFFTLPGFVSLASATGRTPKEEYSGR